MSVYGCVWVYYYAVTTKLDMGIHWRTNMCLIWVCSWSGNFPGHHVLTCMTQKNEKWSTSTPHMCQGPHNTRIQLKQTQTWPNSPTKLAQTINYDTCHFCQKHNNIKLGVLVDLKKINQPAKPVSNLFWSRRNTYAV